MRYNTVLLDIDGTIVDSNDAHAQAWVDTFSQFGYDVPVSRVRPLIGMGGDKLLKELVGLEADSRQAKKMSEARASIFSSKYLPTVKPTPGARAMIEWLKRENVAIAIATSATADEVDGLLQAAGVSDLIDHVTTSDDAEESKPDPDIVVAALNKSGGTKQSAVMIGDTPYDIQAARRAGLGTIAFRTGGWPDDELREAVAIYDSPADFLKHPDVFR